MNLQKNIATAVAGLALLCATGCFRVGSETRALRDAGLEFGATASEEQIEFGVGFFTVGLAKFGTKFVDLPPEVKMVLGSVKGAECSVYEITERKGDLGKVLAQADKAMNKRGCERVVGVVADRELVAVYIPRNGTSYRNMSISVLVLNDKQLVCATARGDLEPVIQMALGKAQEHLPAKGEGAVSL
jgi:hypothetical protein